MLGGAVEHIPQSELAMGVLTVLGGYGFCADPSTLHDRQLLLLFTVLGEGRARLIYAKRSLLPLSTVKHDGFGTFSL